MHPSSVKKSTHKSKNCLLLEKRTSVTFTKRFERNAACCLTSFIDDPTIHLNIKSKKNQSSDVYLSPK